MENLRVLLVDDHTVFRQGLSRLLESEKGIEVIAQAANGCEAITLVKKLLPDVVLMDLEMPELDGIEATLKIKDSCPSVEIIALTAFQDEKHLFQAIKAGISGYISKRDPVEEIIKAIRTVSRGESLLSSILSRKMLDKFVKLSKVREISQKANLTDLTRREIEILKLIAEAKTNCQIAQTLFISERTVKNHIFNIYRKLRCNSRLEATLKAGKLSLIES